MYVSKKACDFNMKDILDKKIVFLSKNDIFDKEEYQMYDEGELNAYIDMQKDMTLLNIDDFVKKHIYKLKEIGNILDNKESSTAAETEKMVGYNNAVVSILEVIDPIYKYDLE